MIPYGTIDLYLLLFSYNLNGADLSKADWENGVHIDKSTTTPNGKNMILMLINN